MILLELYISFLKIGFTSFGGLSMIPLISSEMVSHNWLSMTEVSDIVAIAEMTPGPLGLNCATYAGIKTAGIAGAIAANLGVLTPTFTLCTIVAHFLERFKDNKFMRYIMVGIRPACVGLLVGVIYLLSKSNYIEAGQVQLQMIGLGLVDLFLLLKMKVSIPKVLVISAVAGILFSLF